MSLGLIKVASQAELSDDLHLIRLLFLLAEANKRSTKSIKGITKLAKLDFLLRYPNCLGRLLIYLNKDKNQAGIKDYEKTSIESKMVRFRYGPWDNRYRRWIGLLVSRGLAITFLEGRTVHIEITDLGVEVLKNLYNEQAFQDMTNRSSIIYKSVGSLSAVKLKDLVYKVFPEIISLKWGQGIEL